MENKSLKCLCNPRIQFILVCFIYFLFRTGISMFDTIIGPYMINIVCEKRFLENKTICDQLRFFPDLEDDVRKDASFYFTLYRVFINVPAICSGFVCGLWSDRKGRKIPMIFPCIGIIMSVMCFAGSMYMGPIAVWVALIGACVQSVFGNTAVFGMAGNAYTAEISSKNQRTKHISILAAMSQFGKSFGAFLAGILGWNLLISYGTVIAIYCFTVLMIVLFLREPKHKKTDENSENKPEIRTACFSCSSLSHGVRPYTALLIKGGVCSIRKNIVAFLCLALIYGCDINGVDDIFVMYVTATPFSWSNSQYSYYISFRNISNGILLLLVLPFVSNKLKWSDFTVIVIGLLCNISRYVGTGLSNQSWMIYALLAIWPLPFVIRPCLWSILSKSVNSNELGKMFTLYSVIDTISKVLGSVTYVNLYGATVAILPSTTFFVMGVVNFVLIAFVAFGKCLQMTKRNGTSYNVSEPGLSIEIERNVPAFSETKL